MRSVANSSGAYLFKELLIVVDAPALDYFFGMVDATSPILIEALVTNATVKASDIGTLIRFPLFNEVASNRISISPYIQQRSYELRVIACK